MAAPISKKAEPWVAPATPHSSAAYERARQRIEALGKARAQRAPKGACLLRRAETIIVVPERGGTVAYNYATNAAIDYPSLVERVLGAGNDWVTPERLARAAGANRKAIAACMLLLLEQGFLVVKGTIAAKRDVEYQTRWAWDVRAGLFHLAVRNPLLQTEEEAGQELAEQIAVGPKIRLFETNESYGSVTQLPQPDASGPVPEVLGRRRTRRKFADASISLRTLGDCLYAGLGITGFLVEPVRGFGRLPQKMTPSGGSRNPYEAYVYVLDVEGIAPGIYHYSALEHSLGLVSSPPLPRPSEMLGWQKWTDDAAAVVFLVAHYNRTMWKYPHPMAYRAVLIEAGHIAQNIMIAATSYGLTANPTALFRDSMIESCLQLESILQAVNYAVLLGRPASAKPDFGRFVPNRLARRSR